MSDDAVPIRQIGMEQPLDTTAAHLRAPRRGNGRGAVIDRAEFGELYERYRDPVFGYVRRLCGNEDEAADLTARTFRACTRQARWFPRRRSWIRAVALRIARNQAWDARRRNRPWLPLQLLGVARHPPEDCTPEDGMLRQESVGELSSYLDRLPEIQRECLLLRYGAGLTAREIGAVIGKSDAATQKLITRALAKLKENYRE